MTGPTDAETETQRPAMTHLGVSVPTGLKQRVRRAAHEQSSETQRIDQSDIVREALRLYLRRDPETCDPARRGAPEVRD